MGLHNVVVSLVTPPPVAKSSVAAPVQMDQKQCVFVPRPGRSGHPVGLLPSTKGRVVDVQTRPAILAPQVHVMTTQPGSPSVTSLSSSPQR